MNIAQLYGSWEGRIGRLTYLYSYLALIAISLVTSIIFGDADPKTLSTPETVVGLILFFPSWIIAIKRAHDIGRSGLWVFGWVMAIVAGFIVLLVAAVATAAGSTGGALLGYLIALGLFLASLWCLIIKLFFYAGAPGANQYGMPEGGVEALAAAAMADEAPAHSRAHDAIAAAVAARAAAQRPKAPHPLDALEPKPQKRGLQTAAKPAVSRPQAFGRRGMKPA